MKADLYTKTILTIIAVCLTINVLRDFDLITTARASGPLPVVNQTMDVNIRSIGGNSISYNGAIPVAVKEMTSSTTLNVNIERWRADALNVKVDRWNAGRLDVNVDRWNAGTLEVKSR